MKSSYYFRLFYIQRLGKVYTALYQVGYFDILMYLIYLFFNSITNKGKTGILGSSYLLIISVKNPGASEFKSSYLEPYKNIPVK